MNTGGTRVLVWVLALLLIGASIAGCGPTLSPTSMHTPTPLPTGTLRPTFTPTAVAMITEAPTLVDAPSAAGTATGERRQTTATPVAINLWQREPTPTPPAETPTPAATRAAGPPPMLEGMLLFPVFDTSAQTYYISRLDLATGEQLRLIEQASQPAVTPNGDRIAWRSWNPEQRGLLSRPLGGGDVWRMIPFNEAARPDWAPDGDRFVFPSGHLPDRQSRLYLFTGAGDPPFHEIQRHGSPIIGRAPVFMPDGRIVYQGCVENECGLFLMEADGTSPLRLTQYKDDRAPAVSPDGMRIAYMSYSSGYWQVNVVNANGTAQTRLTDDWYWNGLPVWSPDDRYILFVSTRDQNWPDTFVEAENVRFRLWVMDADGQNQRPLSDFEFRLDGIPADVSVEETAGWLQERMVWLPEGE